MRRESTRLEGPGAEGGPPSARIRSGRGRYTWHTGPRGGVTEVWSAYMSYDEKICGLDVTSIASANETRKEIM